MDEHVTRLRNALDALDGEAGGLERTGRALTDAEARRVRALRYAAELVQRAVDLLTAEDAGSEVEELVYEHTADEPGEASATAASDYGLSGDEDLPGYRPRRRGHGEKSERNLPGEERLPGYRPRPRPKPGPGNG